MNISSSMEPEAPDGWFYLDDLSPAPDPSMDMEDYDVGTTGGGVGAAMTCEPQTKPVSKKSTNKKPVCTCGSNGNTLREKFEKGVHKGMDGQCKPSNGPECAAGSSKYGEATVKNKVGPRFIGETIDGGLAPCKRTQIRFCFASWEWSCDIEQQCKQIGSSSSSSSTPTQVCCKNANAYSCTTTCASPGTQVAISGTCNTSTNCKAPPPPPPPPSSSSGGARCTGSTAVGTVCSNTNRCDNGKEDCYCKKNSPLDINGKCQ